MKTRQKNRRILRRLRAKWHTAQKTDNVRMREEAAARCKKVIKRRVLKKQARKARADHLVKCSLMPRRRK